MKKIITVLIIILIILVFTKTSEGFTVYQLDYGTGIGPWWAQGAGINRGYNRCICSGSGDCNCINDIQFQNNPYPQYYFN